MQSIHQLFQTVFLTPPAVIASAPGRIEIIGNHTDYNGGTVIGACIEKRLYVGIQLREDGVIRLISSTDNEVVQTHVESYDATNLPPWTRYPLGVYDEFRLQFGISSGFDFAVTSEIPTGEGLSSSAAIEMATALSLNKLLDLDLPVSALVGLSHRADNRFVGVPWGLLDQSTVGFGKQNELVVLDASTGRHHNYPMPSECSLYVFRTHIRHELQQSPYEQRHQECRRALVALNQVIPGIRHLAHLHPVDIQAYDIIMDETVARRAQHIVEEQRRVGLFLRYVHRGEIQLAGKLLEASHKSSKELFENSSPELDFLADLLNKTPHVLGARLTGGGWGGAVIALCDNAFSTEQARKLEHVYGETFDANPGWWTTRVGAGSRVEE